METKNTKFRNFHIVKYIINFLDRNSAISAFFVNKTSRKLLYSEDYIQEFVKKFYPNTFSRVVDNTPEEELLEDFYTQSWINTLKEIIQIRKNHKDLILIEPKVPTFEDLLSFAARICNQHSWYKHLPNYPGEKFAIYFSDFKIPLKEKVFNTLYLPNATVEAPSNSDSILTWNYTRLKDFENNNSSNTLYKRIAQIYLNCYLSVRSGSSLAGKPHLSRNSNELFIQLEGYSEYITKKRECEDILRQIIDIGKACIALIEIIYDTQIIFPDLSLINKDYKQIIKLINQYHSYSPKYMKNQTIS